MTGIARASLVTLLAGACVTTAPVPPATPGRAPAPIPPGWFPFVLGGAAGGVGETDLSALSPEPAGARGFVRVARGHFVDGSGARVRFYGTNLTATACFPDRATATRAAAYLRALGINVVRFHFMDKGAAPAGLLAADRRALDPAQLDRLDFFVAELKKNGVYANLNLHVARRYPGIDGAAARRFEMGKVLDRFYPPFIEMQRDYARALLTHRNPYTGTTYAAEPAVLNVELNNENTLLPFWGGNTKDLPAPFAGELARQREAWAHRRRAAARPSDETRFLRETELATSRGLATFVRGDLGVHALLIDTQASYGGLAGLLREIAVGDFIDMHGYWQHPAFEGGAWNPVHWSIGNSSQVEAADGGTLGWMASYRVAGRPFTVSEYNTPAPSDHAAETLPLYAAIAAFQDWDAIYSYTFLDFRIDWSADHILGFFDMAGHPGRMVFSPAAALAFRQGLVAPGVRPITLAFGEQQDAALTDDGALPALWSGAGVPAAVVAARRLQVQVIPGNEPPHLTEPAPKLESGRSDTGEIEWRPDAPATFMVNAPALRVLAGRIAGRTVEVGDTTIAVGAIAGGFASVTLVALDGKPIAASRRLLLSTAARVENSDMVWNDDRTSIADHWGGGPTLAEAVPLTATVPGAWKVRALDGNGKPAAKVSATVSDARTSFSTAATPSLWYLLSQ